jgi:hypothetical protein
MQSPKNYILSDEHRITLEEILTFLNKEYMCLPMRKKKYIYKQRKKRKELGVGVAYSAKEVGLNYLRGFGVACPSSDFDKGGDQPT